MAGVISPSMPVVVVENVASGMRAHATLNEGLGKVLRFGAYDESVLDRLRWFVDVLGPALSGALQSGGPLDLRSLTAQALQMGDEGHNRNIAATSLFTRAIAPALVRTADTTTAAAVFDFLRGNDHFFLNLSMAACKSAHGQRARDRRIDGRDRDGPQRRGFRDPPVRHRRCLVHDAGRRPRRALLSRATAPTTPTPTSATARSPRRSGSAGSRWPRHRRSSASWAAARPTPWSSPA